MLGRQEVEGADVLGLAPWRCQRDSSSAGVRVLLVIEPTHGRVVLSVVVMLQSLAPDVVRWEISFAWVMATVEKSIRILSFSLRSASPSVLRGWGGRTRTPPAYLQLVRR